MNDNQTFFQYLSQKGKNQTYIDLCRALITQFYDFLKDKPPSASAIDEFIKSRWSGYVSRDKATYQILNDYSDFCEIESPLFTNVFHEHIHETFEGEAKKAMKAYKNSIVYIPKDTKIDAFFLGGLMNNELMLQMQS